jgi:ATP-dependent Lon protease
VLKALDIKFATTIDDVLRWALAELPEDHPNQALREFLASEGPAEIADWRTIREWIEERDRKKKLEASKASEHGPH